ncbi:MAG TPA: hypothetical protein VLD63_15475 [Anaerolineales bacterium]|nr:hypothetical protein [Anaerolineales bacterium]
MNPRRHVLSMMTVLALAGLACSLTGTPAAPTPTVPPPQPTETLPPLPSDTPVPVATLPSGSGACQATSSVDITIYTRPSLSADVFSTITLTDPVTITSTSADGWLGFDPGVAQAANIGVFRLRWIPPGASVTLTGNCAGLPVESWVPAPGVCYQMSMGPVDVHTAADPTSAVSHTLMVGEFVSVTGRTATGWLFVNGNDGNVPGVVGFIAELEMNASGPCDSIPTVSP